CLGRGVPVNQNALFPVRPVDKIGLRYIFHSDISEYILDLLENIMHFHKHRERWARGGGRGERFGRGFGGPGFGGGRHGWGEHRGGGGRRMFEQGDLRFLVLSMIAEKPRHGYELIKEIEEKTGGAYAPSPGVVYPLLTMLEEMGFAKLSEEGG